MRIVKIKFKDEDIEMEEWLRNVLPDMCECEVLPTEVY